MSFKGTVASEKLSRLTADSCAAFQPSVQRFPIDDNELIARLQRDRLRAHLAALFKASLCPCLPAFGTQFALVNAHRGKAKSASEYLNEK